ncbi:MAG: maleylpyruvate isomerase family mycothiol-dependent enzyme [Actinobacteria bacterium]|jgi:uncharacterized protein (TIGR03083 family)|nr:maleylpyruvate isomerase family mycothiol-dependent enzyme [Actinomycetota bacterium]
MLPAPTYHESLERDSGAFIEIVRSADLSLGVPSCPGWTLRHLARHLGAVHRWAAFAIRTGRQGDEPTGPTDRETLAVWLDEGRTELLTALRATDPTTPTWHFGPPPREVSFWARRQALETAIHLGDAQRTVHVPSPIDADLAADGVDEVATMFFPRQVRLGRIPPLAHVVCIDLRDGSRASFVLAGDGLGDTLDRPADATVVGSSADVLRALWGRLAIDDLDVSGDRDAVRAVFTAGLTP